MKSAVYKAKRRGASTVPCGTPELLDTMSDGADLKPDEMRSLSEVVCDPGHQW